MRPRWDIDERGHGAADARQLLPDARALLERMDTPLWVTEDVDAHLLPHIARLCARPEVPLELERAHVDDVGALVVECRLLGAWDASSATVASFALLGTVAETGTFVQKDDASGRVELRVATGMVSDEGPFATHGHTLVLRVTGD